MIDHCRSCGNPIVRPGDVGVGERRELICDACLDMFKAAHRAAWARHEARP